MGNLDRKGHEFVSLVQARDGLPFFASQFHPEKNLYEFEIPVDASVNGTLPVHSAGAVDAMSRFAAFLVNEARTFRGFRFSATEFWEKSIAKWPQYLAGSVKGMEWLPSHMQVYYFPPWHTDKSGFSDDMGSSQDLQRDIPFVV